MTSKTPDPLNAFQRRFWWVPRFIMVVYGGMTIIAGVGVVIGTVRRRVEVLLLLPMMLMTSYFWLDCYRRKDWTRWLPK